MPAAPVATVPTNFIGASAGTVVTLAASPTAPGVITTWAVSIMYSASLATVSAEICGLYEYGSSSQAQPGPSGVES